MTETELTENNIYIVSPWGLGDTYILCTLRQAIAEKYGCDPVYVIKPSHVAVAEMFECRYMVKRFTDGELQEMGGRNKSIRRGVYFAAHPHYVDADLEKSFFDKQLSFIQMYKKTLGLDENAVVEAEKSLPLITDELRKKVSPYKLEDVVLFAPEMTSCFTKIDKPSINWIRTYNRYLILRGEKIIVNVIEKDFDCLEGIRADLTVKELIALAVNCKKVVTVRSGLCDLIYRNVAAMSVIYSNVDFWKNYSLPDIFGIANSSVQEFCISYAGELRRRGYENCAIYGMGENGCRLLAALRQEKFVVLYGIDRAPDLSKTDLEMFNTECDLPTVDCIIVTPVQGYGEIYRRLRKKVSCEIIDFWSMCYIPSENMLFRLENSMINPN